MASRAKKKAKYIVSNGKATLEINNVAFFTVVDPNGRSISFSYNAKLQAFFLTASGSMLIEPSGEGDMLTINVKR